MWWNKLCSGIQIRLFFIMENFWSNFFLQHSTSVWFFLFTKILYLRSAYQYEHTCTCAKLFCYLIHVANTKEYRRRPNWWKLLRILFSNKTKQCVFFCLPLNSIIYVRNLWSEAEELRIQRMTNGHCLFLLYFSFSCCFASHIISCYIG